MATTSQEGQRKKLFRQNTLRFDFSTYPKKPDILDLQHWLVKLFNLSTDNVVSLEVDSYTKSVFLRVISLVLAEKLVHSCNRQVEFHADDQTYPISVSLVNEQTTVITLHPLPLDVSDQQVAFYMQSYGTVVKVIQDVYRHPCPLQVYSGKRKVIFSELKKQVPPILHIFGFRVLAFHVGNANKCFRCGQEGHFVAECKAKTERKHEQATAHSVRKPINQFNNSEFHLDMTSFPVLGSLRKTNSMPEDLDVIPSSQPLDNEKPPPAVSKSISTQQFADRKNAEQVHANAAGAVFDDKQDEVSVLERSTEQLALQVCETQHAPIPLGITVNENPTVDIELPTDEFQTNLVSLEQLMDVEEKADHFSCSLPSSSQVFSREKHEKERNTRETFLSELVTIKKKKQQDEGQIPISVTSQRHYRLRGRSVPPLEGERGEEPE